MNHITLLLLLTIPFIVAHRIQFFDSGFYWIHQSRVFAVQGKPSIFVQELLNHDSSFGAEHLQGFAPTTFLTTTGHTVCVLSKAGDAFELDFTRKEAKKLSIATPLAMGDAVQDMIVKNDHSVVLTQKGLVWKIWHDNAHQVNFSEPIVQIVDKYALSAKGNVYSYNEASLAMIPLDFACQMIHPLFGSLAMLSAQGDVYLHSKNEIFPILQGQKYVLIAGNANLLAYTSDNQVVVYGTVSEAMIKCERTYADAFVTMKQFALPEPITFMISNRVALFLDESYIFGNENGSLYVYGNNANFHLGDLNNCDRYEPVLLVDARSTISADRTSSMIVLYVTVVAYSVTIGSLLVWLSYKTETSDHVIPMVLITLIEWFLMELFLRTSYNRRYKFFVQGPFSVQGGISPILFPLLHCITAIICSIFVYNIGLVTSMIIVATASFANFSFGLLTWYLIVTIPRSVYPWQPFMQDAIITGGFVLQLLWLHGAIIGVLVYSKCRGTLPKQKAMRL